MPARNRRLNPGAFDALFRTADTSPETAVAAALAVPPPGRSASSASPYNSKGQMVPPIPGATSAGVAGTTATGTTATGTTGGPAKSPGFDAFFLEADNPNVTSESAQNAFDTGKSVATALEPPGDNVTPLKDQEKSSDNTTSQVGSTGLTETSKKVGSIDNTAETSQPVDRHTTENIPPGQDLRSWDQMDWESKNIARRNSGMTFQEPEPEADKKAREDLAKQSSGISQTAPPPPLPAPLPQTPAPPPTPAPTNTPVEQGETQAAATVTAPNVSQQNQVAADASPVTTAVQTAFAQAQDPGTRSLYERQDTETENQNRLVENLVYNSNSAGQQAVAGLNNPSFRDPRSTTAFGTQQAGRRYKSQTELLMEQALNSQLQQRPEDSAVYQAQLSQYNTQADQDQENLLQLLKSTGNLRGSGNAVDEMSKYYGGRSQGKANLLASNETARQNAINQAMSLSGMNQGNELAEGQMMGNLRGATTLQAQQGQAQMEMDRANMFNQNQQFGANYNLQKLGMGQNIANQELNRAMTMTSPTQREMFTQQQNQDMIGNQLAQSQMTGMLNGRQTMAGQANQANVAGMNLANTAQANSNFVQPRMLQAQLTGMNYANVGQDQANSQAAMLQAGMLTTQQNQNQGMNLANQQAGQQLSQSQMLQPGMLTTQQLQNAGLTGQNTAQQLQNDLNRSLANGQITQQQYQTESMRIQNQYAPDLLQNQVTQGQYANVNQDLTNAALRTQNQFQRANLLGQEALQGQQIQLGNRAITGADLANTSQSLANQQQQTMNPLLAQALGLQNTGQGAQNQLMEQDYTQQNQMFPEQLRQLGLQGRGMELGNEISYQQGQGLLQDRTQQGQLFPGQLTQQGLQTRGMELENDQSWKVNRGIDQEFRQTRDMFAGQLEQQGLQTTGMRNQNNLTGQAFSQQNQLFPGELTQQGLRSRGMELNNDQAWKVNRGIDQDFRQDRDLFAGELEGQGLQNTGMRNQNAGQLSQNTAMSNANSLFPGEQTLQQQQIAANTANAGAFGREQNRLDVAQLLAAANAGMLPPGVDVQQRVAEALGVAGDGTTQPDGISHSNEPVKTTVLEGDAVNNAGYSAEIQQGLASGMYFSRNGKVYNTAGQRIA